MVMKRIIPCLDLRGGRVVKGVRFEGLRDSGDPVELARRYAAEGADELVLLDITAGLEGRRTALRVVEAVARTLFVPFTVGGGIRSAEDAFDLLRAGCDKVSLNSAALRDPALIERVASRFGSQCVVLAVDVRREGDGFRVCRDAGRTPTAWELGAWVQEGQRRGAGEILLTSMDRDGGQAGYDLEALRTASAGLRLPLIASGGFGGSGDAVAAFEAGADAVLLASALHEGRWTVRRLKQELEGKGIEVRTC